jgi:hypothetical protein
MARYGAAIYPPPRAHCESISIFTRICRILLSADFPPARPNWSLRITARGANRVSLNCAIS